MTQSKHPWLTRPFSFTPFFDYETGVRFTASKGGKKKKPSKEKESVTTLAVGEEGAQPPPPGRTTPAMGEEGASGVPTTTIAKGEEGQ